MTNILVIRLSGRGKDDRYENMATRMAIDDGMPPALIVSVVCRRGQWIQLHSHDAMSVCGTDEIIVRQHGHYARYQKKASQEFG